jgi:hypothetical protein
LADISPNDIGKLSSEQLNSFSVSQLASMSGLQTRQLTIPQIQSLSETQINALSPVQLQALSTTQLRALLPDQLNALSSQQKQVMSQNQLAALQVSHDNPTTPESTVQPFLTSTKSNESNKSEASKDGVLSVMVLSDDQLHIVDIGYQQKINETTLRVTNKRQSQWMLSSQTDFSGHPFFVTTSNNEKVEFRGNLEHRRITIMAYSNTARELVMSELPTVLAAALKFFSTQDTVILSEIKGVTVDLRSISALPNINHREYSQNSFNLYSKYFDQFLRWTNEPPPATIYPSQR